MNESFTFFYRTASPFSQWHPCLFKVEHRAFSSAEQYMMAMKALTFRDYEAYKQVMKTQDPRIQKAIGREVKNFIKGDWDKVCEGFVYEANYAKFTQNKRLKEILLATVGSTLVEASPTDCIWGIGLSANNPKAQSRATWRGKNLLGEILTKVREDIIASQS